MQVLSDYVDLLLAYDSGVFPIEMIDDATGAIYIFKNDVIKEFIATQRKDAIKLFK